MRGVEIPFQIKCDSSSLNIKQIFRQYLPLHVITWLMWLLMIASNHILVTDLRHFAATKKETHKSEWLSHVW